MITNKQSGTNIQEVADGIFRINTPVSMDAGDFSFKQYLLVDDAPMLFHTGQRKLFPLVQEAVLDAATRTFFCGDLFTQGGPGTVALTESDILGPSEAFRAPMDYFAHAPDTAAILERLASESPTTLACMHGSAWRGDGAVLLRELSAALVNKRDQ